MNKIVVAQCIRCLLLCFTLSTVTFLTPQLLQAKNLEIAELGYISKCPLETQSSWG